MPLCRALLLLIPLTLLASPAWSRGGENDQGENEQGGGRRPKLSLGAPEIDAAALGGAAVLLAGGAVLLGTRIAKRRRAERT
jgi:hypothetical protein